MNTDENTEKSELIKLKNNIEVKKPKIIKLKHNQLFKKSNKPKKNH